VGGHKGASIGGRGKPPYIHPRGGFMREITGHHEGSILNNHIRIESDDRDENGGAHVYTLRIGESFENIIKFQNGPLQEAGLNGISDEALIAIVIDRLEGFNADKFRCRENSLAITKLEEALLWLQKRTRDRQRRGVEGTHRV
jgi:hypothetical protein